MQCLWTRGIVFLVRKKLHRLYGWTWIFTHLTYFCLILGDKIVFASFNVILYKNFIRQNELQSHWTLSNGISCCVMLIWPSSHINMHIRVSCDNNFSTEFFHRKLGFNFRRKFFFIYNWRLRSLTQSLAFILNFKGSMSEIHTL